MRIEFYQPSDGSLIWDLQEDSISLLGEPPNPLFHRCGFYIHPKRVLAKPLPPLPMSPVSAACWLTACRIAPSLPIFSIANLLHQKESQEAFAKRLLEHIQKNPEEFPERLSFSEQMAFVKISQQDSEQLDRVQAYLSRIKEAQRSEENAKREAEGEEEPRPQFRFTVEEVTDGRDISGLAIVQRLKPAEVPPTHA